MFQPFSTKVRNVRDAVMSLAKETQTPIADITFTVIHYKTFVTDTTTQSTTELSESDLKDFKERLLSTSTLLVTQEYSITFAPIDKSVIFRPRIQLNADTNFSRVFALISHESECELNEGLYDALYHELVRKKLRHGILLGFCDDMMEHQLKEYVQECLSQHQMVDGEIIVCQTPSIKESSDDKLLWVYKEKVASSTHPHLFDRGFLYGVREGEEIVVYEKGVMGKAGRNCKGEFISAKEPIISHTPTFKAGAMVRVDESEDKIRFIANHSGRVLFEGETLTIQEMMELDEISMKKTGSLYGGLDAGIKITVRAKDTWSDAVGEGVSVEADELKTVGSVGANAHIHTRYVEIGGNIHASAVIESLIGKLGVLRGKFKGDEVKIERLESGHVQSHRAVISQASGGSVQASEIRVTTLHSHVQLVASELVEIEQIKGSDNKIILTLLGKEGEDSSIIGEQIHTLEHELALLEKEYRHKVAIFEGSKEAVMQLKKQLLEDKKLGRTSAESHKKEYHKFVMLSEEIHELSHRYQALKEKIEERGKEFAHCEEAILSARVLLKGRWHGFNEVHFIIKGLENELIYTPKEGEASHCIKLMKTPQGYKIITE